MLLCVRVNNIVYVLWSRAARTKLVAQRMFNIFFCVSLCHIQLRPLSIYFSGLAFEFCI